MLNLTIRKEIDYVEEANALLFHYVNSSSYDKLKTEGMRKVSYNNNLYEDRFQAIINIFTYVTRNLQVEKSKLEYYFKEISSSNINLAYYLLPLYSGTLYNSLKEYERASRDLVKQDIIAYYDSLLSQYYMIGKSDDESFVENFEDLTRKLNKTELSAEDKCKIIETYLERDRHIDELCLILDQTIWLIKKCANEVMGLENEFYDYWSHYSQEKDLIKALQEDIKFTWEENLEGTIIMPCIFRPTSIMFSITDKEDKTPDSIRIGVILDSNLSKVMQKVSSEDLYNALKLLSDKSKFEILRFIKDKPAYGFELANELNLSTSTISYHMNSLISANMVKLEKDMNKIYYSMNKDTLSSFLYEIHNMLLA